MATHVCGKCSLQFDTEQSYLEHKCKNTGVKPTNPLSMGLHYEAIQQAALKRGLESKEKQEAKLKRKK